MTKSNLKFSGVLITSSYYEDIKNKLLEKLGFLPYKLFGLWYSLASEVLIRKNEAADLHIDRFLEDREGKPTKEMDVILNTLESMLGVKGLALTAGLHHSYSYIGVQIADFVAGIIADRKNLSKLNKRRSLPRNIILKIDPKIDKKIINMLTGRATLGTSPVSLNSKHISRNIKFSVLANSFSPFKPFAEVAG